LRKRQGGVISAITADDDALNPIRQGGVISAITADDDVAVSPREHGFGIVSRVGGVGCEVEGRGAAVLGRLVSLWMPYKREKRRVQVI
jgi:hypothetical protein